MNVLQSFTQGMFGKNLEQDSSQVHFLGQSELICTPTVRFLRNVSLPDMEFYVKLICVGKSSVSRNMKCVIWDDIRPTFMSHLCIDNVFCRLDFGISECCFSKSTSFAKRHFEISCCFGQVPSKVELAKQTFEHPKSRQLKVPSIHR